jgi:type VI protein secretion system component Hcp
MAAYMWIEGVPGRPGWDDWFEVDSFDFGGQGGGGGGVGGGGSGTGRVSFNTANARKRSDVSSPAIWQRCVHGDQGAASLWVSDKNGAALYQYDMTDAIVASVQYGGSDRETFSLNFAKITFTRATD